MSNCMLRVEQLHVAQEESLARESPEVREAMYEQLCIGEIG